MRARNAQIFFAHLAHQLVALVRKPVCASGAPIFYTFWASGARNLQLITVVIFAHYGHQKLGILAHKYVRCEVYN